MRYTKAQIEKLPEDHPDRMRLEGVEKKKERELGSKEKNRKRMKEKQKKADTLG